MLWQDLLFRSNPFRTPLKMKGILDKGYNYGGNPNQIQRDKEGDIHYKVEGSALEVGLDGQFRFSTFHWVRSRKV